MNNKRFISFLLAVFMIFTSCNFVLADYVGESEIVNSENSDVSVSGAVIHVLDDEQNDTETENSENVVLAEEEIQNSEDVENVALTEEVPEQTELKENSWRYVDGENILQSGDSDIDLASAGAWGKENGVFYNDSGQIIDGATMKGIDVSKHQGSINWNQVKNTDVDYAIIRCGFGDNYSSQDDSQWSANANACTSLGIPFGVYIYSYAQNTSQAKSEADHVLRLVKGYNLDFPIYIDLEDNTQSGLSASTLGNIAKTFCDTVQNAGYEVGVYANKYWWTSKLTSSVFNNSSWHKWVAQYNSNCTYSGDYEMWQATSSGKVSGISGNVDLNFYFGSYVSNSTAPVISSWNIKDVDRDGYTAYATITDDNRVTEVLFPTKLENGNWEWLTPTKIVGNTYYCRIDVSMWNYAEGNYTTHIYAYDDQRNVTGVPCVAKYIDRTAPVISNVSVKKETTGYIITCTVTDNKGVNRVQFPTWTTANDKDDIFPNWATNPKASGTKNGNTYTYNVKYSDHKDEQGFYNTHIYAYDNYGNYSAMPASGGNYYKYAVNFNANGGTGAPASQTKIHKVDLTLSSTKPTRTGYTFAGWGTTANATSVAYQSNSVYKGDSAITLYAIWKKMTYTVAYNANGGSGTPANQTKTYGVNITLSGTKPTRSGYTFLGWATTANATSATYQPNGTYSSNANVTLYAVWKKNVTYYTVSYNANGGTGTPSSQTKTENVNLVLSGTKPTRTGYTFVGWATTVNATSATYQPNGTYSSNADVTLYAVWEKNVVYYTVSYNANGGSGVPSSQTKTENVNLVLSGTKPTRSGYTFLGWATMANATTATYQPNGTYSSNADVTLYAVWQKKVAYYTVSYNANGGSGVPSSQTKTENVNLVLSGTKPTRSGYTFLGWATMANATTATYQPNGTYSSNANVTLYAVWQKNDMMFLSLSGGNASKGGYVDVNVTLDNSSKNLSCFNIILKYDNQIMYPISYTKSSNFSDMISTLDSGADMSKFGEVKFVWDSINDIDCNGNLFTIRFKINDNVEAGDYNIDVNDNTTMFTTSKLEDIDYSYTSTTIMISDIKMGDVNKDGIINGKDVLLLRQYVAGWPTAELDNSQLKAADVTGDGIVNGKDILKIRQYIAGWPDINL